MTALPDSGANTPTNITEETTVKYSEDDIQQASRRLIEGATTLAARLDLTVPQALDLMRWVSNNPDRVRALEATDAR